MTQEVKPLLAGYQLRVGSCQDRALLVQFIQKTYRELFPQLHSFTHLRDTVERYLSAQTPLWWVEPIETPSAIACLWMGKAIDQATGDRYTHIFLLYVAPPHRRQGIATALMEKAQAWAKASGDRQIGLQVFQHNQNALNLYHRLGFQTQSLLMLKPL